jgi:hypothetical protein
VLPTLKLCASAKIANSRPTARKGCIVNKKSV